MRKHKPAAGSRELQPLLELTGRVGSDPLLTQASTGNISAKLDDVLWIKASGKWMAHAMRDDILIALDMTQIMTECLGRDVDPAGRYPGASLETAMHATIPHRVVLHVHCVNTIAWAVRKDALVHLRPRLEGLRWQWVPYTASGLPLSREIENALSARPGTDLFVLGNHGLVIGGEDAGDVEDLLLEVARRLSIAPRESRPANYEALAELCLNSQWDLPADDSVHVLGTDEVSRAILAEGLLYPCQAIFSEAGTTGIFQPVSCSPPGDCGLSRYRDRPFLIVEGCGVVVNKSAKPAELAMISGLAQVVQRLNASAPLRYLTEAEVAGLSADVVCRYRELANANQACITG